MNQNNNLHLLRLTLINKTSSNYNNLNKRFLLIAMCKVYLYFDILKESKKSESDNSVDMDDSESDSESEEDLSK